MRLRSNTICLRTNSVFLHNSMSEVSQFCHWIQGKTQNWKLSSAFPVSDEMGVDVLLPIIPTKKY